MKALAMIAVLGFSLVSQAATEFDSVQQPLVICEGRQVAVQVTSLPSEKEARLTVQDLGGANVLYDGIVFPTVDSDDSHSFMNGTVSFRVTPSGDDLKGYLNLRTDQPGVGQIMNCHTIYRVLPVPMETAAQ